MSQADRDPGTEEAWRPTEYHKSVGKQHIRLIRQRLAEQRAAAETIDDKEEDYHRG